jgi:hypothetical protein
MGIELFGGEAVEIGAGFVGRLCQWALPPRRKADSSSLRSSE